MLTCSSPYKFEAPWTAWEFANHILLRRANLVVLSLAWMTRENPRAFSRTPKEPDMDTLAYWLMRLEPLIRNEGEDEIIVVFANRTGIEGDATYAGTSAVLGIRSGEVRVYGVLGRGERELLVIDTSVRPQARSRHRPTPYPTIFLSHSLFQSTEPYFGTILCVRMLGERPIIKFQHS